MKSKQKSPQMGSSVTIGVEVDNGRAVAVLLRGREIVARRAVVANSSAGALAKVLDDTPLDAKIVVGLDVSVAGVDVAGLPDSPWGQVAPSTVSEIWDVLRGRDAVVTSLIHSGWGSAGPGVFVRLGEESVDVVLSSAAGVVDVQRLTVPGLGWLEADLGSGSDVGRRRLERALVGSEEDYTAGLALADWFESVLGEVKSIIASWRNQGRRVPDGVILLGRAAGATVLGDLFAVSGLARALLPARLAVPLLNLSEVEKLPSAVATFLAVSPPPSAQCFPDPRVRVRRNFKTFPKKARVGAWAVLGLGAVSLGIWGGVQVAAPSPVFPDVQAVAELAEGLGSEFWEVDAGRVAFTFPIGELADVPHKVGEVQRTGLAVSQWEAGARTDGYWLTVTFPSEFFSPS